MMKKLNKAMTDKNEQKLSEMQKKVQEHVDQLAQKNH